MAMHPAISHELTQRQLTEALETEGLFNERVVLEHSSYPRFFVRFLNQDDVVRLIQFDCTNYDTQPIDIRPVEPVTKAPLPNDAWLKRNGGEFPSHPMLDHRFFLCLDGTRLFYSYPGHQPQVSGQRWEALRQDLRIADLIGVLAQRFASREWA